MDVVNNEFGEENVKKALKFRPYISWLIPFERFKLKLV